MKFSTIVTVFGINTAFVYFGLKSVSLETMAAMALAFTVLTLGGLRLVRIRL